MGVIYQIVIAGGSRTYIGSAQNFGRRKRTHMWMIREGKHHCIGLRRAVAKYGIESVSWRILEEVPDENLLEREQVWLNQFEGQLYNASPSASSVLGFKKTSEQKEKSAKFHRGRQRSEATRASLSVSMKGNTNGRHTAKSLCGKGHSMSGDNLYTYRISSGSIRRACKVCQAENNARQHARRYPKRKEIECATCS